MQNIAFDPEFVKMYGHIAQMRNLARKYDFLARAIRRDHGDQTAYCLCLTRYAELTREADELVKQLPLVA